MMIPSDWRSNVVEIGPSSFMLLLKMLGSSFFMEVTLSTRSSTYHFGYGVLVVLVLSELDPSLTSLEYVLDDSPRVRFVENRPKELALILYQKLDYDSVCGC